MEMPKITTYGGQIPQRISLCVTVGSLKLFFSCGDMVAFHYPSMGLVCQANKLGGPLPHGTHLNSIEPDYTKRITEEEFEKQLRNVLECGIL